MELLVILFAVGVFIAIISPRKSPPPKSPWVKLGEAVDDILRGTFNDCVLRPKKKEQEKENCIGFAILISVLVGIFAIFGG
jgi:hypothetical protein